MTQTMTTAQEAKLNRISSEMGNCIHINGHLTAEICNDIARIALGSTGWKSLKAARAYILKNRLMYVAS